MLKALKFDSQFKEILMYQEKNFESEEISYHLSKYLKYNIK